MEKTKYEEQINGLEGEKQTMKQEIDALQDQLQKYNIEKKKIENNQTALIQQFGEMENSKGKKVETVQAELDEYKANYKILQIKKEEDDNKQKEEMNNKMEQIKILETENINLKKKVQTEKNHLDAVLREIDELEQKQKDMEKNKVIKKATQSKHDLSKLDLQIEILNSDAFRMKSLLLLSKYEKVGKEKFGKKKFYGFLDFAENDLNDKALKNVYNKLKVTDKISASQLAPLLSVILKL